MRIAAIMLCLGLTPAAFAQDPASELGRRLFDRSCAVCHTKPHLDSGTYGPLLSRATLDGREDVMRDFIQIGTKRMPGFRYEYEPGEIAAIVRYIKTLPAQSAQPEIVAAAASQARAAQNVLLSGVVTTSSGEKLGGAAVSAKAEGSTITTTVFTEADGAYVFPPLAPGKYRLWSQAVTYATSRNDVDLEKNLHQDFALSPLKNFARQLSGDQLVASLPADSADDKRLQRLVQVECTSCHTPSFPLQHRFDEAGWTAILDLMKHVNVSGIYLGPEHKANGIIEAHEKELAAYLARARGPEPEMTFKLRPRPSGEAARVVFREYDVPLDPAIAAHKYLANDGGDWSLGAPGGLGGGHIVHDAWADLDGNLWFTNNTPSPDVTLGHIDAKTGAVGFIKLDGVKGMAVNAHGMTRDPEGHLWFNTSPVLIQGHGGLARLDPRTGKIDQFLPPPDMSGTGGATTVDFDGKGKIWSSAPDGALRFDPATAEFTAFKSPMFNTPKGRGTTYGLAADRDGNGWWEQMQLDIVDKADIAARKAIEVKLPPVQSVMETARADDRRLYEAFAPPDFNTAAPWAEGPRRMGADKNGDVVWVCASFGGNLIRIDTHTLEQSVIPLPGNGMQHPYHATVDSRHNVWINGMNADQVMKYDPAAKEWTLYDLPTRGAEPRYISLLERDGSMEVVVPYARAMKVAVMTFRSEAEVRALEKRAK